MSIKAHAIVGTLVLLTVLASIAEIVLASLVLHYLNTLNNQSNYAYNGVESSSADPMPPFPENEQNLQFNQPWVLVHKGFVSAIPRIELATGAIALVLGGLIFAYILEKAWTSRQSGSKYVVSGFDASDRIAQIVLPGLGVVITGLFAYIFAVSSHSPLTIYGPLGGPSYDGPPTWEEWTCSMSSFLKEHRDFPAARSEWNTICQITVNLHSSLFS